MAGAPYAPSITGGYITSSPARAIALTPARILRLEILQGGSLALGFQGIGFSQANSHTTFVLLATTAPDSGLPSLTEYMRQAADGNMELHAQLRVAVGGPVSASPIAYAVIDGLAPGSWRLVDDADGELAGQFTITE